MKGSSFCRVLVVALAGAVTFSFGAVTATLAQSAVKVTAGRGAIQLSLCGASPFVLEGTASHLGRFTAQGELDIVTGQQPGSLVGEGVVIFTAANGDLLAGVATFDLRENGLGHVQFSWRDAVQFADGTAVATTGRFVDHRPADAVVQLEWAQAFGGLILVI